MKKYSLLILVISFLSAFFLKSNVLDENCKTFNQYTKTPLRSCTFITDTNLGTVNREFDTRSAIRWCRYEHDRLLTKTCVRPCHYTL